MQSELFADKGCDFFASKVELAKDGVGKVHGLGELAEWENELLDACVKDLAANIKKVIPPLPRLAIHDIPPAC